MSAVPASISTARAMGEVELLGSGWRVTAAEAVAPAKSKRLKSAVFFIGSYLICFAKWLCRIRRLVLPRRPEGRRRLRAFAHRTCHGGGRRAYYRESLGVE